MRKVLNFVKGKKDDKKDTNLSLNVPTNISVEITDPAGVTTPSDDYDYIGTTEQCTDYEVDLSGKDKTISKLHKAAWAGNSEKLKTHLKKIDVNVVDGSNRTPLHLAAAQGHTNIVWILLSNKARMDIYDSGGKTSFLKAVEGGQKEIVSNMLEKGADMNSKDTDENTALHIATKLGFYDIASILLKKGANFECANKKGEFPLHIATLAEHMDLVNLLLRYGAGVNVTDTDSHTPLMLAARCGNSPLVELFLEYGAKKDMVDNNSFTAQDYAINKGYGDLAALLVTATSDIVEAEDMVTGSESNCTNVIGKQRSVSSESLVPANGSHQDESEETAEDANSWNDSETSTTEKKVKIPTSKLKEFLKPTSDDESGQETPSKDEKNMHDSPHSCVIPPPLKPPRSWDLIQAGMIDNNTGSEVKRCSLTTLGTLRSRRESFNDSNKSDIESPSAKEADVKDNNADKGDVRQTLLKPGTDQVSGKHDKSDLSAVESDWDSDESLPLDKGEGKEKPSPQQNQCVSVDVHHAPVDDDDLPAPPSPSQLIVPEEPTLLQVMEQNLAVSPEPVSEKRARMLLMQNQQSVELTLTDDRTADTSDHSEGSPSALPKDTEGELNGQTIPGGSGTLGREGTMLGYEEMWESNAAYIPSSPTGNSAEAHIPSSYSLPRIDEKVEISEGEQSPNSLNHVKQAGIPDKADLIRSPISRAVDSIPPPAPLALVGKSQEVEDLTKNVQEITTKTPGTKRHVRNKSIFLVSPVEKPSNPQPQDIQPVAQPVSSLSGSFQAYQDHCINRQLECYDEAIRDLALAKASGSSSSATDKSVNSKVPDSQNLRIMPDLLAGSKVAALAASFSMDSSSPCPPSKLRRNHSASEVTSSESKGGDDEEETEETDEGEVEASGVSKKQHSVEKPIRKKRKSLLAMQKFEPPASQSSVNADVDVSSSESDEEPVYWGSTGLSKIPRQSTVIKKGEASDGEIIEPPSRFSGGSVLSEDVHHTSQLSSGTSNEDVTAPMEDVEGSGGTSTGFPQGIKMAGTVICDSDMESGSSQPDGTPTHSYVKSHESLLKHHLQAVTEERGRLAETTVELGERTERLLYELADAREATRAKDEVIALLQLQLHRLEESHSRGLEEVQTHRFHLDSRDQELRHLEDVCRKADEEKLHLKEIIRLKDKEIASLGRAQTCKEEEVRMQFIAQEKEKDVTISELSIHLKYVEQERDKLKESIASWEQQQASLQTRSNALLEEKVKVAAQNASELRSLQEEINKWRNMYESALVKLEAVDSTQVKTLLDAKNEGGEIVQAYHAEIKSAMERLEKDKEADRNMWQERIKEEVGNAVQMLKSEYEKVELALRKHNETLESIVQKLQKDLELASKRQESLESQLSASQKELQLAIKGASEAHHLQSEVARLKNEAFADGHKLSMLSAEVETKDKALSNVQGTLEIVRKENKELAALMSDMHEQKQVETSQVSEAEYAAKETQAVLDGLRVENANLKAILEGMKAQVSSKEGKPDETAKSDSLLKQNEVLTTSIKQLKLQLEELRKDHEVTIKELNAEKEKVKKLAKDSSVTRMGNESKTTSEFENLLKQEKEELERQVADLRVRLQKRDSSPGSASLSNASAMTDQVRWNQSGLMGVVQKQKDEIENLKAECAKLKGHSRGPSPRGPSPNRIPPEIKQRPGKSAPKAVSDAVDLLQVTTKQEENRTNETRKSSEMTDSKIAVMCEKCGSGSSLKNHRKISSTETQTIQGCESPARSSTCSSPRHNWHKKVAHHNIEQELQAQAERCLKHQQMIAGLKSELHLLRGSDIDEQLNLQKQISDLKQKIKEEMSVRCNLEIQMNKMKYEVQEKGQLEKELQKLKGRLEKDFVSRRELDHLKLRARLDTDSLHSELSTKLAQVNKLLLQHAHDRSTGQVKESAEAQIRKEYEETRQYLVSELAKVQSSLQAKEDQEKELKLKCEKLSRECDKKNEQRRRILIEKSYNLGYVPLKDKDAAKAELKTSSNSVPYIQKPTVNETSGVENPYSQILSKELKKSVEKYKTSEPISELAASGRVDDHLDYLKKKYCLP